MAKNNNFVTRYAKGAARNDRVKEAKVRCNIFRMAIVFVIGAALGACGGEEAPTNREGGAGTNVIPHRVELQRLSERVEAVGTARAQQQATIFPETGGEVTGVFFEAGDFVEAGAILAAFEDAEERLDVARARVALKEAQQLLDRYGRIDVEGAVSESQIDAARTAVEAAQIELRLAEETLADRQVRAPFAGYVGIPQIDPGARIGTDTAITQLDARTRLFIDFEAPEQVFNMIQPGDRLSLQPFAAGQQHVEAVVRSIGARIDPQRRLFQIRAEANNEADRLRPGMSFRVGFDIPGDPLPSVPEAAIVWGGDGAYVWAVKDGRATQMAVTIVSRTAGQALVRAPLQAGDLIVAEGVQKMREGALVDLLDARPERAAPPPVPGQTTVGGAAL
ncbi:RND family efflux system membrane fusion protein [Parvularcula bermudensis HTCC2503]|uniref:RND family efflux system membrane fusion protein n=1 Tax=Parvularcula bermudensis (strain ATCC BAA-594 / HTCC2503 / KCTC 12087) TaxID=314260 RepID=E0TDE8_PARBH|nr:RND family efflux system membrane fusion protein [Parvularcula bermudensis HTCC2503]